MNKNVAMMCLALGSLLAAVAGCGKTENAPPPPREAESKAGASQAEPAPAVEKPAATVTNATVSIPDAAKPSLDAAAKVVDGVGASAKPAPVQAAASNNAVPASLSGLAGLSQDQMVQGLGEALGKGLRQAVGRLGHDGGFLTNLNVKIPMPDKLQKVETTLRALKQDKLADDFVATMNHAAEQAVPEAATVFADALGQMTIDDAKSILTGSADAATQYFQKTTQTNLYAKFFPIVQKATAKTGVTAAYKNLVEKADVTKSLGSFGSALSGSLLDKDSMDVDAYVTNKALEGLFKMVAEEEKQIRQNPVARTSDLLQKVFGSLKK